MPYNHKSSCKSSVRCYVVISNQFHTFQDTQFLIVQCLLMWQSSRCPILQVQAANDSCSLIEDHPNVQYRDSCMRAESNNRSSLLGNKLGGLMVDLCSGRYKLLRHLFHALLHGHFLSLIILLCIFQQLSGDLHTAEFGTAHAAEVGSLCWLLWQCCIVVCPGCDRVKRQMELVIPSELKSGSRKLIIPSLSCWMLLQTPKTYFSCWRKESHGSASWLWNPHGTHFYALLTLKEV